MCNMPRGTGDTREGSMMRCRELVPTFTHHARALRRVRRVCATIGVHMCAAATIGVIGDVRHVCAFAILACVRGAIIPRR